MNEKDQRHLDAVIALYEKKLKESVDLKALKKEINATKLEFSQGHKNAEGNINSATSVNAIFALERLKDRIWAEKEAKKNE